MYETAMSCSFEWQIDVMPDRQDTFELFSASWIKPTTCAAKPSNHKTPKPKVEIVY